MSAAVLTLTPTPETKPCPECNGTGKAPWGDPFAEQGDARYDDCDRCKGDGNVDAASIAPPLRIIDGGMPPLGSFMNPRKHTDAFGNITFSAGATGITLRVSATGTVDILVDEMCGEGDSNPIIFAAVEVDELHEAMMARAFANGEYTEHEARELDWQAEYDLEPVEACPSSGGKCRKCNDTGIAPVIDPMGGDSGMGDRCDCLNR